LTEISDPLTNPEQLAQFGQKLRIFDKKMMCQKIGVEVSPVFKDAKMALIEYYVWKAGEKHELYRKGKMDNVESNRLILKNCVRVMWRMMERSNKRDALKGLDYGQVMGDESIHGNSREAANTVRNRKIPHLNDKSNVNPH
jgi:hypothetical protein